MTTFYKELDFLSIPDELLILEDAMRVESDLETVSNTGYGAVHTKNGQLVNSCKLSRQMISVPEFQDWLLKNILLNKLNKKFIVSQESQNNMPSTHIVHSDIKRKMALNYVIQIGGTNVTTSWYRERGKELYRSKGLGNMQSDSGHIDYNNLDLLESVVFQKGRWYALDVEVLHDVDNIISTRKSISIGFMKKIYLE